MNSLNYILWGTGVDAERFYYQYHNIIKILYCVDNVHYGEEWHGIQVKHPNSIIKGEGKILVATELYYAEIKKQLQKMGFLEYKDFDFCFHINKKIVFINGNCHCRIIKSYLETVKEFTDIYVFGSLPLLYEYKDYDERILEYCDLFLHQDIRKENSVGEKYSDEYMIQKLRADCVRCCIPNLYGHPKALFYKNHKPNKKGRMIGRIGNPFAYCEEIIDECMNQNQSIDIICERLNGKIANKDEVLNQFQQDKEKLLEREENWDIKISDFIYQTIHQVQLFYDVGHPTNILLKEIANRILKFLNIQVPISAELDDAVAQAEVPVYDDIRKILGIQWQTSYLRNKGKPYFVLSGAKMDLREYIREYIWWCYGKEME